MFQGTKTQMVHSNHAASAQRKWGLNRILEQYWDGIGRKGTKVTDFSHPNRIVNSFLDVIALGLTCSYCK